MASYVISPSITRGRTIQETIAVPLWKKITAVATFVLLQLGNLYYAPHFSIGLMTRLVLKIIRLSILIKVPTHIIHYITTLTMISGLLVTFSVLFFLSILCTYLSILVMYPNLSFPVFIQSTYPLSSLF